MDKVKNKTQNLEHYEFIIIVPNAVLFCANICCKVHGGMLLGMVVNSVNSPVISLISYNIYFIFFLVFRFIIKL